MCVLIFIPLEEAHRRRYRAHDDRYGHRRARLAPPHSTEPWGAVRSERPSMLIKWSITRRCHRRRRVRSPPWPARHPHSGYLPVTTEPGSRATKGREDLRCGGLVHLVHLGLGHNDREAEGAEDV